MWFARGEEWISSCSNCDSQWKVGVESWWEVSIVGAESNFGFANNLGENQLELVHEQIREVVSCSGLFFACMYNTSLTFSISKLSLGF